MNKRTKKRLKDFVSEFYPDRVGDKGFMRRVKKVYKRENIGGLR